MQRKRFPILVAAAALGVVVPTAGSATPKPSSQDRAFVAAASESNLAEIAAGRVALKKANASERGFAQRMISDHTKMQAQLKSAVSGLQIEMVTKPSSRQEAATIKLAKLSGAAFDKAYRTNQINAHRATLVVLRKELSAGDTAALKQIARAAMPKVQMHLKMATSLRPRNAP